MVQHKSFILNKLPYSSLNLDLNAPDSTFKLTTGELPALRENQLLVKTLYLSNDPTQRAWIQKGANADRMYTKPVREGQVMRSAGLAQVVDTRSAKYLVGDIILCGLTWSDYCIVYTDDVFNKVLDKSIPLTMYLDVLGMTGLTAYFGLFDLAQLKATDTIVISAASGATGSMCVQIAKKVIGCKKVVGITGGDEKCEFVKSMGADECVNYKDKNFVKNLRKALGDEKYCDVYFDGVGGRILDTMLTLVKPYGTIIASGAIAGYNDYKKSVIYNWPQIILNKLTVKGFIILDYSNKYPDAIKNIVSWIKQGKIIVNNSSFAEVDLSEADNFTKIPETWGLLFSDSKAPGKLITKIASHKL